MPWALARTVGRAGAQGEVGVLAALERHPVRVRTATTFLIPLKLYGVSVNAILRANWIADVTRLQVGERL
jgi:hypothetical protein